MEPTQDFSYRPLQNRYGEILDHDGVADIALSEIDIDGLTADYIPRSDAYISTLRRLVNHWTNLQACLAEDCNSGQCREIGRRISARMDPHHVRRVVRAYVEYAPRATVLDLERTIRFVRRFMTKDEDGDDYSSGQDDDDVLDNHRVGSREPNLSNEAAGIYINTAHLAWVAELVYNGVKAAKAAGGSPKKGRSRATSSKQPGSPFITSAATPFGACDPSPTLAPSQAAPTPATTDPHPRKRSIPQASTNPPEPVISNPHSPSLLHHRSKRSRVSSANTSPTFSPPATPKTHSRTPTQYHPQTTSRDNNRCIITSRYPGTPDLQVAHILPYSVLKDHNSYDTNDFWKFLRAWLGEARSSRIWRRMQGIAGSRIGAGGGGGWLFNLMTLTRDMHALFGRGQGVVVPEILDEKVWKGEQGDPDMKFLMPVRYLLLDGNGSLISPTRTLPGGDAEDFEDEDESDEELPSLPKIQSTVYTPPAPLSSVLRKSRSTGQTTKKKLPNNGDRVLCTGEIIVLYNYMRDNENYPLPHPDLLRLWGAVSRVVRMSGMGELVDLEKQMEEDGEAGWLCDFTTEAGRSYLDAKLECLSRRGSNRGLLADEEDQGLYANNEQACQQQNGCEHQNRREHSFDSLAQQTRKDREITSPIVTLVDEDFGPDNSSKAIRVANDPCKYHIINSSHMRRHTSSSPRNSDPEVSLPSSHIGQKPMPHRRNSGKLGLSSHLTSVARGKKKALSPTAAGNTASRKKAKQL